MKKISFAVPMIQTASAQDPQTHIFLLASLEVNPDSLDLSIKDMDEQLAISLAVYQSQGKNLTREETLREKNDIELDLLLSHFANMANDIVGNDGYARFANVAYKAGEKPAWLIASSNKGFLEGVEGITTPFAGESTEESLITGMGLTDNIEKVRAMANMDKLVFTVNLMMLCPFFEIQTLDLSESKHAKLISYFQNDFSKALDSAVQALSNHKGIDGSNVGRLGDVFREHLLKIRDLQQYKEAVITELNVKDRVIPGSASATIFTAQGIQ